VRNVLAGAGSLLFWGFIAVSSILLFPVALLIWALTRPFDRRTRLLHQFTCFWASLYTWLNPLWRVRITGKQHIRPGVTYVMVSNHLSLVDILVLFRLFVPYSWVSKEENFSVPFVGWNMRLNGYIPLKRGDKASAAEMMDACRATLRGGTSIMMFPEGTRSRTGELQAFKPGAFSLARETGSPLLPIVLDGSARALPKRGFVLRGRSDIAVHVLGEVPVDQDDPRSATDLANDVRTRIAAELAQMRPQGAGSPSSPADSAG
jgi:1-acyl-sn-glycerol-3-phosphate acyltransferase